MKYILAALAIIIAAVFISTSCPTAYLGDSGETASAAYTLGIGHPPGYPLQMLLGKIFTNIPLADIAFRVNLMSASAGVCIFLLFFMCSSFTLREFFNAPPKQANVVSILTAFVFIFSTLLWSQTVHAKGSIYLITYCFILIAYYFTVSFVKSGRPPHLYMAAYAAGFLPALHHITLLFVIFCVVILFSASMHNNNTKRLAFACLFFIFSVVTSFIYLFIRVKARPVICWDEIYTAGEVINHIFRTVYFSVTQTPFSFYAFFTKIFNYILQYIKSYNILIIFLFYGLYTAYFKNKKMFLVFIFFIALNTFLLIVMTTYSFSPVFTHINEIFYLITDIFTLFIASIGICALQDAANKKYGINILFVSSLFFLIPVLMLFSNFDKNNASKKFLSYDISNNILGILHPGDILFVELDCPTYDLLYSRYVRKQGLDIQIYDRYGSFFDRSIYKIIRYKFTRADADAIESSICLKNPGKVFYTDTNEYEAQHLKTKPYGVDYIMMDLNSPLVNADKLMRIASFRDYFNNKNNDIYYREVLSRHFIQYARYAMASGDINSFKKYCDAAESISPDNPSILKIIAYMYYYDEKNIQVSAEYLLKTVKIDPYDLTAMGILINMYTAFDPQQALNWFNVYISRQTDTEKKLAAYKDMKALMQALSAQHKQ